MINWVQSNERLDVSSLWTQVGSWDIFADCIAFDTPHHLNTSNSCIVFFTTSISASNFIDRGPNHSSEETGISSCAVDVCTWGKVIVEDAVVPCFASFIAIIEDVGVRVLVDGVFLPIDIFSMDSAPGTIWVAENSDGWLVNEIVGVCLGISFEHSICGNVACELMFTSVDVMLKIFSASECRDMRRGQLIIGTVDKDDG